jgi:hypothetical protein
VQQAIAAAVIRTGNIAFMMLAPHAKKKRIRPQLTWEGRWSVIADSVTTTPPLQKSPA